MTFLWPKLLWLLLLVPVLVGAYLLAQRIRKRYALRYASVSLVREAVGQGPGGTSPRRSSSRRSLSSSSPSPARQPSSPCRPKRARSS